MIVFGSLYRSAQKKPLVLAQRAQEIQHPAGALDRDLGIQPDSGELWVVFGCRHTTRAPMMWQSEDQRPNRPLDQFETFCQNFR